MAWHTDDWFLLHGNAPAHSSLLLIQFLTKMSVTVIDHPSYSLDPALINYFLFSKLKTAIKAERIDVEKAIQQNVTVVFNKRFGSWFLQSLLATVRAFQYLCRKWRRPNWKLNNKFDAENCYRFKTKRKKSQNILNELSI